MKITLFFLGLCLSSWAFTEPTLEGKVTTLEKYLTGTPKNVTLTTSVKQSLPLKRALVKLSVVTEAILLADALKKNLAIRQQLRSYFEEKGINPSNIKDSKFSSTPEYAIFNDKPKSYRIENTISVNVASESEMITIASAVDNNKSVYYLSSKVETLNDERIKKALLEKTLAKSKEKAAIYERELEVKLVPIAFIESEFETPPATQVVEHKQNTPISYKHPQSASFGEATHRLVVSITYQVHRKE